MIEARFEVIEDWSIAYPNPIKLKVADEVSIEKRETDPEWGGWIFCIDKNGIRGWVSENHLQVNGSRATAIRDYDATELEVKKGEQINAHRTAFGWVWASNAKGLQGWVPMRNLKRTDSRSIATDFTFRFVRDFLLGPSNLLEVGCGFGHLAKVLNENGHRVLAIDVEAEAIASARKKGVLARQAKIEDVRDVDFDSILFTRSLHHIRPIAPCLDKALGSLKVGGSVLIEDFGFDLMDAATAVWFQGLRNSLAPIVGDDNWTAPVAESLGHWIKHHTDEHELHRAADLEEEVRKRFPKTQVFRDIPYLFRYFVGRDELPLQSVEAIFSWEKRLIDEGTIKGIGLRIVGQK